MLINKIILCYYYILILLNVLFKTYFNFFENEIYIFQETVIFMLNNNFCIKQKIEVNESKCNFRVYCLILL